MNVLVTGATGHLGRSVVHALASAGHRVTAASRSGAPPAAPFGAAPAPAGLVAPLAADLGDDAGVAALAAALAGVDAVAHLGAWHPPATAATTPDDRARLLAVNALGTMRLLEAVKRAGAKAAVVYASTFEVYGAPAADPVDEGHPTRPLSDYGVTKLAGEDHLVSFAQEDRVRYVALRLPAVYGPGEQTPRALPLFLRAVAAGEAPTIYGDGADERDLLY
ncbi:MAG TPA: SDR family oxidoreductase, partial [Polyangiaceae bacterium]|nr:SDR family oxidoreductase [Polyangiaceae bacterium]